MQFVHKDSMRPSKRQTTRKDRERFAITFCEASVHAGGVGNSVTGRMAEKGFSPDELKGIQATILEKGGEAVYIPLETDWVASSTWMSTVAAHPGERSMADLEAGVLVIRNGADFLCGEGAAHHLFEEQCSFPYDRLYYNSRQHKMLKKNARYNIEFGPNGQEQAFPSIGAYVPDINASDFEEKMALYQEKVCDYNLVNPTTRKPFKDPETGAVVHPSKKSEWLPYVRVNSPPTPVKYFTTITEGDCTSTVKAFDQLPYLNDVHEKLGTLSSKAAGLFAEGNHYYGHKSNINYHGDGERKRIICLCLGKSTKLTYQWRFPEADNAVKQRHAATITCNHGDIYIMSEKAGGYDWKFGRNQWPEPRLVHGAAFEQSTLDAFMAKKSKKSNKK